MFKLIAEHVDEHNMDDVPAGEWSNKPGGESKLQRNKMDEDLYCLLVEKCQDVTSETRVKSVPQGEGVRAYMKLREWYLGASGQATQVKLQPVMLPNEPKNEEDIADAIDKWREQMRQLEGLGANYKLPDQFNK